MSRVRVMVKLRVKSRGRYGGRGKGRNLMYVLGNRGKVMVL